ncbi:MAG TPA: RNA pseudouridine synthase, partial [Gammaproteobacteria bacterium]|nr:RNA pseudouridine synthase [Gammaproteobacteria bacterium]
MIKIRHHEVEVTEAEAGLRLDKALSKIFSDYSRSIIKGWIDAGRVKLNSNPCRPRDIVTSGDTVHLTAVLEGTTGLAPEVVDFNVVHIDEACIVVDKPAGCVVHPGAGNSAHTLVNGLLYRYPELTSLPRAGLVHRLDKNTSGLLIVARTGQAYQRLVQAMAAREIKRVYSALCNGRFVSGGTINEAVGRDPKNRTRMKVRSDGREAITHYRVATRFRAHTHLEVSLETGRTHQIRVHLSHLGHPVVGDRKYGSRLLLPPTPDSRLDLCLRGFTRQALHAQRLEFKHPT